MSIYSDESKLNEYTKTGSNGSSGSNTSYELFKGENYDIIQMNKLLTDITSICGDNNYGIILSEDGNKQNILFNGIKHTEYESIYFKFDKSLYVH